MEIEAKSKYSYEVIRDFQRFNLFKGKHYNKGYTFLLAVTIFALITTTANIIYTGMDLMTQLFLIIIITINVLISYMYFMMPKRIFKNTSNLANAENTYIFTEDEIIVASTSQGFSGNTTMSYNKIIKVYETKKYIYIYINKFQAYIIDKEQIINASLEELREIILSKIPKQKYIRCKD